MLSLVLAVASITIQPHAEPDAHTEPGERIWRVAPPTGEDVIERPGPEGLLYRAGPVLTDTKLPVGYPRPTPPGAIEIKTYPSVRQAEVSGSGSGDRSSRNGFWPLFQHISRNDIAMTAPVEMRYSDTDGDEQTDRWTMAFLYHVPENGPTGTDEADGRVEVIDTEPLTVVAIGLRGSSEFGTLQEAEERLEAWLGETSEWEPAGDVRRLGYNGPNIRPANRWWEVQIPIRRVDAADTDSEDAATNETI